MIKILAKSIREYKKPSILAPVLVSGEVVLECIIPVSYTHLNAGWPHQAGVSDFGASDEQSQ